MHSLQSILTSESKEKGPGSKGSVLERKENPMKELLQLTEIAVCLITCILIVLFFVSQTVAIGCSVLGVIVALLSMGKFC